MISFELFSISSSNLSTSVVTLLSRLVILLWKDDRGTNRIDGLFYTDMDGSSRRQTAEAHLWFSKWATGSDYKFILNTNQQGLGFSLVTCTYNGAKWWGLRHINDQAVDFYFDGSMSY
jgi:hypothetical protein